MKYKQNTQRQNGFARREWSERRQKLTQYVDRVGRDDVLRQLHVEPVADDHQRALAGVHRGRDVRGRDPAA